MSYRVFVAPLLVNHWSPHSNNHLLNTLLTRLSTTLFGLSQFSLRLPALAGAVVYIAACYFLCKWSITGGVARILALICLIFNPFIGDFYTVARGYSLALGFMMTGITLIARVRLDDASDRDTVHHWILASTFFGLSFIANFPFAFINAVLWAALLLWTLSATPSRRLPIIASSVIPGLAIVALLASWTLLHWPAGELFAGTRSLGETFGGLVRASMHMPNAELANPYLLQALNLMGRWLIPVICVAALFKLGVSFLSQSAASQLQQRILACILLAAGMAAMALHWLAFVFFGTLLPVGRLAIYLIPLWSLAIAIIAALPATSRLHHALRSTTLTLLTLLAIYYGTCLRTNYCYDWWAGADVKDAYYAATWFARQHQLSTVAVRQPLADTLEFYRRASADTVWQPFENVSSLPDNGKLFMMYESLEGDFIPRNHLRVVYRGTTDRDLVIAVSPDVP